MGMDRGGWADGDGCPGWIDASAGPSRGITFMSNVLFHRLSSPLSTASSWSQAWLLTRGSRWGNLHTLHILLYTPKISSSSSLSVGHRVTACIPLPQDFMEKPIDGSEVDLEAMFEVVLGSDHSDRVTKIVLLAEETMNQAAEYTQSFSELR